MGDADILHVIKTTVSATPCKSTHRKMEETATLTKDQRSGPCCTVQLKAIVKAGLHHSCLKRWVRTMRQKMVHCFLPHDYFFWNSASVQCFLWSPSYFKTSTSDFLFQSFPALSPYRDGPGTASIPAAVGLGLWLPWGQLLQIPWPVELHRFTADL